MAHRSRIGGFSIDCQTDDLSAAAAFWGKVLGVGPEPAEENYMRLGHQGGLSVEVQKVDHPSRVHLDIETDDIEAEVARLVELGAKRFRDMEDWVVMEAPTGHRFCVVPAHGADFEREATTWE